MILFVIAALGLIFGSFINALVYRLHVQSKSKRHSNIPNNLSIVRGRSICPNCKHQLGATDLVPIVSWVVLRAKCRYCHKPISWQYPVVELITSAVFALSYIYWPNLFNSENYVLLGVWLAILVCFIALSIYDIKWKLLPNKIVFTVVILSAANLILKIIFFGGPTNQILGALWGVLLSAGIFYLIYLLSSGKWIGGGDIKLALGLGALIGGPSETILMLFGASLLGIIISLPFLATNKLKTSSVIPFGPFLIVSTTVCFFFGSNIINWYQWLIIR